MLEILTIDFYINEFERNFFNKDIKKRITKMNFIFQNKLKKLTG